MFRVSQRSSPGHRDQAATTDEHEVSAFGMLDVVRLERAQPDHGLRRGATGTIVEIFERPEPAYEVEFTDETGEFLAEIPVTPDDLSLVERAPPPVT